MSLFVNQLNTLITTLSNVKDNSSFDITQWHKKDNSLECGYAACICGHQAVAHQSKQFKALPVVPQGFYQVAVPQEFYRVAKSIGTQLKNACEELMDETCLAEAIIGGAQHIRLIDAEWSELFTDIELTHPHLTKTNPTIKEAISFIKLAISKVESL